MVVDTCHLRTLPSGANFVRNLQKLDWLNETSNILYRQNFEIAADTNSKQQEVSDAVIHDIIGTLHEIVLQRQPLASKTLKNKISKNYVPDSKYKSHETILRTVRCA